MTDRVRRAAAKRERRTAELREDPKTRIQQGGNHLHWTEPLYITSRRKKAGRVAARDLEYRRVIENAAELKREIDASEAE